MGAPQIIYIALLATSLGINIALHGKPKEGTNSFWAALFGCALQVGLLIWGGFFS